MKYAYAAAAAAFTALAIADNVPFPTTYPTATPTLNAEQSSSLSEVLESDLATLISGIANDPAATAALEPLATISDLPELSGFDFVSAAQTTGTPAWWTEIPSSAQVFLTSLLGAEYSIYTKDLAAVAGTSAVPTGSGSAGAAPTQAPAVAAAGFAAAGVVAGAALLL